MIRPVTFYQAVCDRCGKVDNDGEYAAWADDDQALTNALNADWHAIDERGEQPLNVAHLERLMCPDCWTWSEDGEHIVPRPAEVTS